MNFYTSKLSIIKKSLINMLVVLGVVLLFVCFPTYENINAQEIPVTANTISNFWDENIEHVHLLKNIPADNDMLLVIDYRGPRWEKVFLDSKCVCENTFCIQATSCYYENNKTNNVPIYTSEKFNWTSSQQLVIFLPQNTSSRSSGGTSPYYTIELWRENNGGTNQCQKDYASTRGNGMKNGSGKYTKDCLDFSVSCYKINCIRIANNILNIGDRFTPSVRCDEFSGTFKWRSNNDSIISVESDGTVVANNSGSALLTLSLDGQDIYSQTITVRSPDKPQDIVLYENESKKINVSGISGNLKWASNNSDVAIVTDGYVQAKGLGETVVFGTYGSFMTSFKVTVRERELSFTQVGMYSGEKKAISLSGSPSDAKWSSDNDKIVSISNGILTAKKPGTAVIQVKTGSQTLECKVTVFNSQLNFESMEVTLGEPIFLYLFGSPITPEISSSNNDVIKVKNGTLTSVGIGKATVSYTVGDEVLKCKIKVNKKPAPTGFEYEASSSIIKLRWDGYESAKNFSVYMYDADKNSYELVSTVKTPSYTAKDLKAGKTYIFKVAANVKINDSLIEQTLSDKIKCKTEQKDKTGWQTIDGKKYYYKDGFAIGAGLQKINGNNYIFDSDRTLATQRFTTIDGAMYYSDNNGKVAVNTEVTNKDSGITYTADKNGVLTKKKNTSTSTKTVTFNDITMEIPTSWGSVIKDGDSYSYSFGSSIFQIYTDPKNGSLTQSKADSLVKEFKDYCCTSLEINKSKKYTYDKKISTYYLYTLNLSIPNGYGYGSTACKGRLTAFEYNGKYYVAVMMVEKSKCDDDSFDEYTEVIKSIKPITKSDSGTIKKNSGTKTGSGSGSGKSTGRSSTVYITKTGSKYHYKNPCGNGTYYAVDLSWAIANGYGPCGKCAK